MELDHEQNVDSKRQQILQQKQDRKQKMHALKTEIIGNRRSHVNHARTQSHLNDESYKDFKLRVTNSKKWIVDKIKLDEQKRRHNVQRYRQHKLQQSSQNYLSRKSSEQKQSRSMERQMQSLEGAESQLLSKLQNTQANMGMANKEYMSALDQAYGSQETRIQSLKQKLEKYRSKHMHGNEGHNRSISKGTLSNDNSKSKLEK